MEIIKKNIIVTGGAKGIGQQLVKELAQRGANLGVFDIDEQSLESLKSEHSEVFCKVCDISDYKQIESADRKSVV